MKDQFDQQMDGDRIMQPNSESVALPKGLEEKIVQQLKARNMIIPSRTSRLQVWTKIAAAAAVMICVFGTGYFAGKTGLITTQAYSSPVQEYLMVLYSSPDFIPDKKHVKEYGDWMQSVNISGVPATGQELSDYGWTIEKKDNAIGIEATPVSGPAGPLSGFFLLRAPSQERAMEIAASCPHLKYRGIVELRPIQQH